MKYYINMNNGDGIETIDEFENMKEAYSCCKEYKHCSDCSKMNGAIKSQWCFPHSFLLGKWSTFVFD